MIAVLIVLIICITILAFGYLNLSHDKWSVETRNVQVGDSILKINDDLVLLSQNVDKLRKEFEDSKHMVDALSLRSGFKL